ncbi:MAG TPA: Panacea domain-containing protein [Terriglobales bacterium]|nr:Panacea domain-containing protein [Terriglobales bacterium]
MAGPIGDEGKLAELILYISQKCATDPKFGAVKLNKILYLSDFLAFGNWGEAITAVPYQHLRMGPAPARLLPIREELQKSGKLVLQTLPLKSGKRQVRTVNLVDPDLKVFSGREIALVDSIIADLWNMDAEESSEFSHRFVGWKMTKEGDPIPYGSIFISDEPLSPAEIERGQEIARELHLTNNSM